MHTGEIELRGKDIGGIAVHIGARVAAQAQPSEVLVSQTATDLVAGSGIEFERRGEHELKGVPGSWRLYAALSVSGRAPQTPGPATGIRVACRWGKEELSDSQKRWIYDFSEGSKDMGDLLGGNCADFAEMTRMLGPDKISRGFTVTT